MAAGVATWITDAGFSVGLRTVGAAIGSIIGPLGATVGSVIGNAIGGMLSCTLINKIFPMEEKQTEQTQIAQEQPTPSAEQLAKAMPKSQNGNQLNFTSDNLTSDQVQKLAYNQAFPKNAAKINGFYA